MKQSVRYARAFMNSSPQTLKRRFLLAALLLTISTAERLGAAEEAAVEVSSVYRCPGPPILYTDSISPEEAKSKNCRRIEGGPSTITVEPDGLTSEQIKICTRVSDMSYDMTARKSRGWSKEEQIQHYRMEYGDSDPMVVVNELLILVYGPTLKASGLSESRKAGFKVCKAKFDALAPRRK